MSTRINTNIEALNAQRNLTATASKYASSVEKLSSGLRINRAADDAAGLAISEKLQAQVTGLNQAQRNAQDGVSMVQTAEGALAEVHSMLNRIRELAVEAANSTLSAADSGSVSLEITALQAEIDRIGNKTTFNGLNLLTGSLAVKRGTDTMPATYLAGAVPATASSSVGISNVSVAGAAAGKTFTLTNSGAVLTLSDGSVSQQITVGISNTGSQALNFDKLGVSFTVTATNAAGVGASATEIATGLNNKTVVTAAGSNSALFQIGANEGDTMSASFADARVSTSLASAISAFTGGPTNATAGALITAVDTEISSISTIRAGFGAVENRLNHTVAAISVASENLNASMSRIKDLDMAAEMVTFTKNQIMQQAGTSILAQANSAPQNILTLLR
ncbi:MAG TPA: flagellin [Candidatus Limnocylindrales bacterium]